MKPEDILFKAQRVDNGEWVEGYYVRHETSSIPVGIMWTPDDLRGDLLMVKVRVIPETVCQYTGLKDKNGAKIFEGDEISKGKYSWVVFWSCRKMRYKLKGKKGTYPLSSAGFSFEITGNIHDKPSKQCIEFPFFGAKYPDARCVDGYLHDLDSCDENGSLYIMEESHPCPQCNGKEFVKAYGEDVHCQALVMINKQRKDQ